MRIILRRPKEPTLHPTHYWGQRPVYERAEGSNVFRQRMIPCCLNCLVDGYEDKIEAFQPCRRIGARMEVEVTDA